MLLFDYLFAYEFVLIIVCFYFLVGKAIMLYYIYSNTHAKFSRLKVRFFETPTNKPNEITFFRISTRHYPKL